MAIGIGGILGIAFGIVMFIIALIAWKHYTKRTRIPHSSTVEEVVKQMEAKAKGAAEWDAAARTSYTKHIVDSYADIEKERGLISGMHAGRPSR